MHLPETDTDAPWPPLLAVEGPGGRSAGHAHHAIHLALRREGALSVRLDGAAPVRAAGVWTGPDVPHAIDSEGASVILLFVDPESRWGARLRAVIPSHRLVEAEERDALLSSLSPGASRAALTEWAQRLVEDVTDEARPHTVHPRVRKLLRALEGAPLDADALSLEALAAEVGLSPSRLMHAFTESVGIPLRPYLRWLRLQRAAAAIVGGTALSVAAAEAGFSDASHMSRTFKDMFGMPPSALAARAAVRTQ